MPGNLHPKEGTAEEKYSIFSTIILSKTHVAHRCHHREIPVCSPEVDQNFQSVFRTRECIPNQKVRYPIPGLAHFAYMRAPLRFRFASERGKQGDYLGTSVTQVADRAPWVEFGPNPILMVL
jgi:hypothetical protein